MTTITRDHTLDQMITIPMRGNEEHPHDGADAEAEDYDPHEG